MKRSLSIVMSLVAFGVAARTAHATFFHTSGSACVKSNNNAFPAGQLMFGGWRGTTNMSTTTDVMLTCPVSLGYSSRDGDWSIANGGLSVQYFDDSTSSEFDCWVYRAYWDGSWTYNNPKYTCTVNGSGSGCTPNSGNKAYTGVGSISWSGTELAQYGLGSIDLMTSYEVVCMVPRRTGGEGSGIVSVVVSYGDT